MPTRAGPGSHVGAGAEGAVPAGGGWMVVRVTDSGRAGPDTRVGEWESPEGSERFAALWECGCATVLWARPAATARTSA